MIPIQPDLAIRPLESRDNQHLLDLLNRACAEVPFTVAFDLESLQAEVVDSEPDCVYPVRWQRRLLLGAWRARRLIGFADIAIGMDSESAHLPDYQPLGLLRILILPEQEEARDEVGHELLKAAERFWRDGGVGQVKAFHFSTGYPSYQAGIGVLPGDWPEQFRILTAHGFFLSSRHYCLFRFLDQAMEERIPMADLNLVYAGDMTDLRYEVYWRSELIGNARMVQSRGLATPRPGTTRIGERGRYIGHLTHIEIVPSWRQQKIGKWLLRRMLADAVLQGIYQVAVFPDQSQYAALTLFAQQGFEELNYRGYVLEKVMTQ